MYQYKNLGSWPVSLETLNFARVLIIKHKWRITRQDLLTLGRGWFKLSTYDNIMFINYLGISVLI